MHSRPFALLSTTCLIVAFNLLGQPSTEAAENANAAQWVLDLGGRIETNRDGEVVIADLQRTFVVDEHLDQLLALPALREIHLGYTKITDLGLERLIPLENVKVLNLRYAENITDLGIAHLKHWRSLEQLDACGTKVTSSLFQHLTGMSRLRSLDVGFSRVNDDFFEQLADLENLQHLGFGGNKMSGAAFPLLKLIPSLTSLDISGEQRTDSGLWSVAASDFNIDEIAQLKQLKHLDIANALVSDQGVAKLAGLQQLESLNLSNTRVSAKGLEALSQLPQLEQLKLWQCSGIGDDAVPVLAKMPSLKVLQLQETAITADGVSRLAMLSQLEQLHLGGVDVSDEVTESLQKQLPECRITHWSKPEIEYPERRRR